MQLSRPPQEASAEAQALCAQIDRVRAGILSVRAALRLPLILYLQDTLNLIVDNDKATRVNFRGVDCGGGSSVNVVASQPEQSSLANVSVDQDVDDVEDEDPEDTDSVNAVVASMRSTEAAEHVNEVEEEVDDDDDDDGVKLCPLGDLSIADFNDLIADDPEDVLSAEVPEQLSVRAGQRTPQHQQQQQMTLLTRLPPPPRVAPPCAQPSSLSSTSASAVVQSSRVSEASAVRTLQQQLIMLSMPVDADESNSSAPPLSALLNACAAAASSQPGGAGGGPSLGNKCMRPKRKSQRPVKLDQETVDGVAGASAAPLPASADVSAMDVNDLGDAATSPMATEALVTSVLVNADDSAAFFVDEDDGDELQCPECPSSRQPAFSTWSAYLAHLAAGHGEVGGASCRTCRGTFSNRATLLAHECLSTSATSPGRRLAQAGYFVSRSCPVCLRHFEERARFLGHAKRAHKAKGVGGASGSSGSTSRCALCHNSERVFQSTEELSTHLRMAHNKFACSLCCKPVATEAALQAHLKAIHANAVSRCQHCALVFGLERELRDHVTLKHSLRCPHCGLAVQKKGQLLSHLRLVHGIRRLGGGSGFAVGTGAGANAAADVAFHCAICARSFASRQALQLHKQQKHSIVTLAIGGVSESGDCRDEQQHRLRRQQQQQQKQLQRRSKQHRRQQNQQQQRQHPAQPRRCPVCAKLFRASSSLHRHLKLHQSPEHRRQNSCPHCPYATHDQTNFARHLIRHTDQRRYACPQCPKRFLCKKSLSDHLLFKHSEARSFPCEECGAAFKTRGTLLRHLREHGPAALRKRHQCDLCGNRFVRLYNLKRHCAYAHKTGTGGAAAVEPAANACPTAQMRLTGSMRQAAEELSAAAAAEAAEDAAAKSILDSLVNNNGVTSASTMIHGSNGSIIQASTSDIVVDCKPIAVSTTLMSAPLSAIEHQQQQQQQQQQLHQHPGIWRPAVVAPQPADSVSIVCPSGHHTHQHQQQQHQSLLDEILWGNPSMSSGSSHVECCGQPAVVVTSTAQLQHHQQPQEHWTVQQVSFASDCPSPPYAMALQQQQQQQQHQSNHQQVSSSDFSVGYLIGDSNR